MTTIAWTGIALVIFLPIITLYLVFFKPKKTPYSKPPERFRPYSSVKTGQFEERRRRQMEADPQPRDVDPYDSHLDHERHHEPLNLPDTTHD